MNDELRRRIEKEIDASGFPLELDVARELQKRQWLVTPNLMFDEHDSDATHEIDAVAMAPASTPPSWPFGVIGLLLLIECKRSRDKPWVFFTHEWDPFSAMGLVHKAKILSELQIKRGGSLLLGARNSVLSGHHLDDTSLPVARTYFEAFKDQRHESDIFKAVKSVWHAGAFARRWFQSGGPTSPRASRTFMTQGTIVVDGELAIASMRRGKKWSVEAVNHLLLITIDALTDTTISPVPASNEIIIDVVRASYFPKYLSLCRKDSQRLGTHLRGLHRAGLLLPRPANSALQPTPTAAPSA